MLTRISPPWFLFLELLFLAERFGICQGDVAQMVLSTLLSQLQMVGQKHTSKDYVPQLAKLWRARFRATVEEPFQNGPKTIKTSPFCRIEIVLTVTSLGGFALPFA